MTTDGFSLALALFGQLAKLGSEVFLNSELLFHYNKLSTSFTVIFPGSANFSIFSVSLCKPPCFWRFGSDLLPFGKKIYIQIEYTYQEEGDCNSLVRIFYMFFNEK
jgi:hypothetical protein